MADGEDEKTTEAAAPATEPPLPAAEPPAEPAPLTAFQLSTWTAKVDLVTDLREFEGRRVRLFEERFLANERYWKALRLVIEESLDETRKLVSFLRTQMESERQHADAMAAIPHKVLMMNSVEQQQKEEARKAKQQKKDKLRRRPSLSARAEDVAPRKTASFGPSDKAEKKEGESIFDKEARSVASVMNLAQQSAAALRAYCEQTEKELLADHLLPAQQEFEHSATRIIKAGALLIAALQKAEASTAASYHQFNLVAQEYENLSPNGVPGMAEGYEETLTRAIEEKGDAIIASRDLWMEEFRYRLAVGLLQVCWGQATSTLAQLFTEAKAAEALRRQKVQGALRIYAAAIGNQYSAVSGALTSLVGVAEGMPVEPQHVDQEILAKIEHMVAQAPSAADDAPTDATNQDVSNVLGSLKSPLESPMITKCGVLHLKEGGIMTKWTPVLAVATADGLMHMFKIPSDVAKKAQTKNWPDVQHAFPAVIPSPTLELNDQASKGKKRLEDSSAKVDEDTVDELDVEEDIVPDTSKFMSYRSVMLTNTNADFKPTSSKHDSTFELVELVGTHGMASLLKSSKKNKLTLKAPSQDDMVEWVVTIQKGSFLHQLTRKRREDEESKS